MFRDISLLFKHRLFMNTNSSGKKRNFQFIYLIGITCFFLFLITRLFDQIYTQFSRISIEDIHYGDIYFYFLLTLTAIFFVISFASMMSFQLKRNEEIEFLLTLPIRKSAIVTYQLLTSGISMFFSLILSLSPIIVYLSKKPLNEIILGSIGVLFNILFLILLGALIAVLFSRISSQKTARVSLIIVNMGMGAIFILMYQILPNNLTSPESFPQAMISAYGFFSSAYNILILGLTGSHHFVSLLFLILLTVICGYGYYYLSEKMTFHQGISMFRLKKIDRGLQGKSNMLLRKELILYKRHEQLIYYILYPVGFAIFMGIINTNLFSALYMVSIIGPLFIAMQTSFSMNLEGSSIATIRMLPIDLKKFIQIKLFVPVVLNVVLLLITFVVFALALKATLWSFALMVPVFLLEILAALSGVYFILKREPQKLTNPGAFLRSGAFMIQYLMLMVLSLLTVLPVSIVLLDTNDSASNSFKIIMVLLSLLGIFITIMLSMRFWKKISQLILTWQ